MSFSPSITKEVEEQSKLLESMMPSLLAQHRDKWVVFYDQVLMVFEDERSALRWAERNVDPSKGYVVAEVTEPRELFLNAAFVCGLP